MPLSLLSAPPPALTAAELAEISAATPSTFEGIAPLLRHKEERIELTLEPAFEGFGGGSGSLYITEGAVSFYSAETSSGISIPYPNITLHAISRAPLRSIAPGADESATVGGGPCIYCQLDDNEGEGEIEDDDVDSSRELIIIPADPTNLEKIFEAFSLCASLHPPSSSDNDIFSGLDPDSTVFADADGIEEMTAEEEANLMSSAGRAARAHLESIITYSTPSVAPPTFAPSVAPQTNGLHSEEEARANGVAE